jgi:outer membrane receptor protein involved in Fe transport
MLLCLIAFLLMENSARGQKITYTLTGVVQDSRSKESLFYASVGLLKTEDSTAVAGVSTNEHGRFEMPNVPEGHYRFIVSYIGYDGFEQPLDVSGDTRLLTLDTVQLQPQKTTLEGVTIYEQKPVYLVDGEKTVYNVSEDVGIQTGTASDALQNAPGVEVDIEGNITLRGVSSVEIWINDKPSKLNAENLKTYIQQLPANSLERIEVITNPSARYSSTGTGGIINIITKSNIKKNSFISFGINASTRPGASPWLSYMWANEKFSINIYLYGYYSVWNSKSNGYNIMLDENKDTTNAQYSTYKGNSQSISTGLYFNASYTFDTMNSISFWMGGYGNPSSNSNAFGDYSYYSFIPNVALQTYTAENTSNYYNMGGYGGLWYEHKFNNEGHKISAHLNGNYWLYHNSSELHRLYSSESGLDINRKNLYKSKSNSASVSIDYSIPYSKKGEISLGASSSYGTEMDYSSKDTLLGADVYGLDSMRFYDMEGKTFNFESYLTIQQKISDFTVKGGLRLQYQNFDCAVLNQPQHNRVKSYTGLFPSLHLSYSFKSMDNITLSYTRRINYPDYDELTTFITYGDESYSTGNKDLVPTYSNSVETGWTKYFKKFGSVGASAYFRNSKDEINSMTDVIYSDFFGRYIQYSMPVNSGKSHSYGIDGNMMYKLKSFMNIRFNASLSKSHSETLFRNKETVMTDNLRYSFRLSFWAKLWKVLELNLSGNYRSPTKSLFIVERPTYSINGGLRADVWKKKISLHLNVQDIFNWNKQRQNTTNPYYISYSSTTTNSRYISVGITFRFGKIELEQQAKTGAGQME